MPQLAGSVPRGGGGSGQSHHATLPTRDGRDRNRYPFIAACALPGLVSLHAHVFPRLPGSIPVKLIQVALRVAGIERQQIAHGHLAAFGVMGRPRPPLGGKRGQ